MLQSPTRQIAQSWFTTSPHATESRAIAIIPGHNGAPPLPAHMLSLIADKLDAPVELYFNSATEAQAYMASDAHSAEITLIVSDAPLSGPLATLPNLCTTDLTPATPLPDLLRQIDALTVRAAPRRAA